MFLSRAAALAVVVCLAGCQSSSSVTFARPKMPTAQQAVGGVGYSGTATFDAPVVNPNTWTGSPIGTGTWSAQSAPPRSGGTQSIAAAEPAQSIYYLIIGNLSAGPSEFFGIISTNPFAVGSRLVDNSTTFAGIFDGNTGDPIALASGGTLNITAAGATIVGTFNGTLEDYQAAPQCTTNAQCPSGSTCQGGRCVPTPPQCTSNAQCPAGSSCQNGTCVSNPNPTCTSNSQCSSPAVCQNGQCVVPGLCRVDSDCPSGQVCDVATATCVAAPQCTSNAQCPAGSSCVGGACVPNPPQCTSNAQCPAGSSCVGGACVPNPPQCTSNAQCPAGSSCQGGACVPNPPQCTSNAQCPAGSVCAGGRCVANPGTCQAQGTGGYSGSVNATATCSALGSGAISVSQGFAALGEDENGQLALFVIDGANGADGVVIPLSSCPAASGSVSVSGAKLYSQTSAGAGLTLYAVRAASGTVTFTTGGPHYTGTFSLTLAAGGTVSGNFDVQ